MTDIAKDTSQAASAEVRDAIENVARQLVSVPLNDIVQARALIEQAAAALRIAALAAVPAHAALEPFAKYAESLDFRDGDNDRVCLATCGEYRALLAALAQPAPAPTEATPPHDGLLAKAYICINILSARLHRSEITAAEHSEKVIAVLSHLAALSPSEAQPAGKAEHGEG